MQERIHRAAMAAGRPPGEIMLLAVSKTKPASDVAAPRRRPASIRRNYLQDALPRSARLPTKISNGISSAACRATRRADISRHFTWVHGIDSLKHAEQLSSHRPAELPPLQVCIQVNPQRRSDQRWRGSRTRSKRWPLVARLPRLRLRGLMTMPDPNAGTASRDAAFAGLRGLLESLRASGLDASTRCRWA